MSSEDLAFKESAPAYAERRHEYSEAARVVESANEVAERFPRVKDWAVTMAVLVVPVIVLDALVGYGLYRAFSAVF